MCIRDRNYYLISYLDSTERKSQPAATTKIEWLYKLSLIHI